MEERQFKILDIIIREYIKNGIPVSSGFLVQNYDLDCSSATVRNEMAELEDMGLISQPHTSAGRIPTEKAFNLYLDNLEPVLLSDEEKNIFKDLLTSKDEYSLKQVAKNLAALSSVAVFWAFHRRNVYYTGVTNLLSQPEFTGLGIVYDISAIIDRLDEIIYDSFDELPAGPSAMIGTKCPFGDFLSTVLVKYNSLDGQKGIFGLISPLRSDYGRNLALINHINNLLK